MASAIWTTPFDAAELIARLRNSNPCDARASVTEVPALQIGSRLVFRGANVESLDQERLMLFASDAHRFSRVRGVVTSLRGESSSDNTKTPASGHLLLKLDWLDTDRNCYRNFSARSRIYSADFPPRYADGRPSNIHVGDVVSGLIAMSSSQRQSATITGWGHGRLNEFLVQPD